MQKTNKKITIKKGLSIPIQGAPEQVVDAATEVATVALLGHDCHGLRPGMAVSVGDRVRLGQTLFIDKRSPEIRFTAPGAGIVTAINRGARRVLQSVVISLEGEAAEKFKTFSQQQLDACARADIVENLLSSGLWTAFRTRPFSHIPSPADRPAAIFVTAIDTNPLAAEPDVVITAASDAFRTGLRIIARLTDGKVYVCTPPDSKTEIPDSGQILKFEFSGPHPAGLVGTHIHFLEPVSEAKSVWHLGYQDVIAMGRLFTEGSLPTERVVALGGPCVLQPRLLRTRLGASTRDLLAGETEAGPLRVVSGSVLAGHRAAGPLAWLGRYSQQLCVLAEGAEREFLAWARPGTDKYSSARAYAAHLLKRSTYRMTTTQNGSPRAMVSIGSFEKLMPLDILATPLLKALLVEDTDRARELGCLELDEEDLALCSFVCNGKYEYGPFLRMNLDEIEANG